MIYDNRAIAERALLFYATKYDWVRTIIEKRLIDFGMTEECTKEEIKDYIDVLLTDNKTENEENEAKEKMNRLLDELLIELNYLYNYNDLLDTELDKIDGKVEISHLRCLTHSLEKEIIQATENTEKIFRTYHKKDYE